jgi:hypothetical protein
VGAVATLAALVLGGATAGAAGWTSSPQVTHAPEISGQPYVGEQLTASGAAYTPRDARATYYWLRCANTGDSCGRGAIATGPTYRTTEADLGKYLRVLLVLTISNGSAFDVSDASPAIGRKPAPTPDPTPMPTPTPTPTPAPTASSSPPPVAAPVALAPSPTPAPSGAVAGAHAKSPRFLKPFPTVRIKGWLTPSGAQVTMLVVRAPRGSRISVNCRGAHCPRRRLAHATRLVHLRPYERLLRGNMRLKISVTRRGYVGKRTVLVLHRGKSPTRRDLCLYPGARKAKACPGA